MRKRTLFGWEEPFSEFETENKEEIINILKMTLKEKEELSLILNTSEKEEIYKKINKQVIMYKKNDSIENHKVQSEIMLKDSEITLVLDTKEKKFELKEVLEYSAGSTNFAVKEVQILLEEYATIISKEKIDYRLEREKEKQAEELKISKKREEEKEFDDFFAV